MAFSERRCWQHFFLKKHRKKTKPNEQNLANAGFTASVLYRKLETHCELTLRGWERGMFFKFQHTPNIREKYWCGFRNWKLRKLHEQTFRKIVTQKCDAKSSLLLRALHVLLTTHMKINLDLQLNDLLEAIGAKAPSESRPNWGHVRNVSVLPEDHSVYRTRMNRLCSLTQPFDMALPAPY